jgi:cysteine desulfurase / selenocysteine lyase
LISGLAEKVVADFPILKHQVRGVSDLVYLDSAATSQKPNQVITAVSDFYQNSNATVHRSGHELGELASAAYEQSRSNIAQFVGISADNLIFTKNATEGLNLVAYGFLNATLLSNNGNGKYSKFALDKNSEILLTEMEHHANLVPWQYVAEVTGAKLKFIEVDADGRLIIDPNLFNKNTKVVSLTHQSNVLGTINDIPTIVELATNVGAPVVLDACQSAPHMTLDLVKLGVAAAAWSGHKMLGPTGVGCLYLNDDLLKGLPPFLLGGNMIENVNYRSSTYRQDNGKFEAGTMNIAQVVGLSAAVNYLSEIGMQSVHEHEMELIATTLEGISELPGIRVLGPLDLSNRGGLVSFEVEGVHPHDVSQFLDSTGIAVRAGHHCAWPLHRKLNAVASTRASFYIYNSQSDVNRFLDALSGVRKYFKVTS